MCVAGGNRGLFATIKVDQFRRSNPTEIDTLLPLSLENRGARRGSLDELTPLLRVERLGDDIVNSISIHKVLPDDANEDEEEEIVAVLTNNDKTVRVYSLTQDREITKLEFPFPMNHATISPDGHLLVAVGDYHHCFFFERVRKMPTGSSGKSNEANYVTNLYEWCELTVVRLHVPPNIMTTGYFTTAWSSSGTLCAVGSECGYISVFDVDELLSNDCGEDALIHLIRSTRPATNYGPGAVRTMCFSPPPWDLLIWSEDCGRACIVDLRSSLSPRQVLTLDPKEESVEQIEVTTNADLDFSDLRHDQYFMGRLGVSLDPNSTFGADYPEAATERRRTQRYSATAESDDDTHGFNAREIMEALRTARRREQEVERLGHDLIPRSINYSEPSATENEPRAHAGATSDIFLRDRTLVETLPSIQTLENYLLGHPQSSLVLERSSFLPRRQASVVLSTDARSASPASPSLARLTSIPPHARRVSDNTSSPNNDGWPLIEAAIANENARGSTTLSTSPRPTSDANAADSRRLRQITRARERRYFQNLTPEESNMIRRGPYRGGGGLENPSDWGLKTTGVAMSEDGRALFVGTAEGIFEYKINVHARKLFPAMSPR